MTALRSCAMELAPTRDTLANVVANCPAEPVYDDFAQCQLSLECTDWAALCGGMSPTSFPAADQSAAQRAELLQYAPSELVCSAQCANAVHKWEQGCRDMPTSELTELTQERIARILAFSDACTWQVAESYLADGECKSERRECGFIAGVAGVVGCTDAVTRRMVEYYRDCGETCAAVPIVDSHGSLIVPVDVSTTATPAAAVAATLVLRCLGTNGTGTLIGRDALHRRYFPYQDTCNSALQLFGPTDGEMDVAKWQCIDDFSRPAPGGSGRVYLSNTSIVELAQTYQRCDLVAPRPPSYDELDYCEMDISAAATPQRVSFLNSMMTQRCASAPDPEACDEYCDSSSGSCVYTAAAARCLPSMADAECACDLRSRDWSGREIGVDGEQIDANGDDRDDTMYEDERCGQESCWVALSNFSLAGTAGAGCADDLLTGGARDILPHPVPFRLKLLCAVLSPTLGAKTSMASASEPRVTHVRCFASALLSAFADHVSCGAGMPRIRQIVRLQVECGYANVSLIPKPTCADINADGNEIDSFDCADDPNEMLLPETAEEQAAITCADWTCEYSECCTRAPPPPPRTCGDPDADGVANPFDCSTSPTRSALLVTLVRHTNPSVWLSVWRCL